MKAPRWGFFYNQISVNILQLYELFCQSSCVCTDSRNAEPGAIFFALKGDNFDGNLYAEKALEKCSYAVIDQSEFAKDDRYIVVEDVLVALQQLAAHHRRVLGTPVIAITGTNGKTTTKELVAAVMSKKYKVAVTEGNYNNHIGVPLTLLKFTNEHEFGIVEMGANHIGEIKTLCDIAQPDFGLITNVGKAHLEGFGSFDGVKKAKSELYHYLYETKGMAFVNYDNEHLEEMRPPHSVIYYGTGGFTHCQGLLMENDALFMQFKWLASEKDGEEDYLIQTKLIGNYNFENALAAVAIGSNFNVPPEDIVTALEEYVPQNSRSQLVDTGANIIFKDSYNANPTSMRSSIANFTALKGKKKMLILGDMLELGKVSQPEHGVVVDLALNSGAELCCFVGPNFMDWKGEQGLFFADTRSLMDYFKQNPVTGFHILLKGSRGIKLEELMEAL